jgi:polar amino acid transport system substrate-binding protein
VPTAITFNGSPLPIYATPPNGLLAEIKARGVLFNGVNAANPPFESVDENGVVVGYDIDLTEAFAKSLGVHLSTVDTAWDGVIPSLYAKKFDMIWSAMTITDARKKAVSFSSPYMGDQAVWIVRANDKSINSYADLNGKVLCTQLNSAYEAQAKQIAADNHIALKDLKSFQDFPTAYLALKNGQCDAATSSTLNNIPLNKTSPGAFRDAIVLPNANYVGVATRLADSDLAAAIQKFIDASKADGSLKAMQQKWFGFSMNLPPQ